MKFQFDEQTMQMSEIGELSPQEIQDARDIAEMISTPTWKRFKDYMEVARDNFIDKGKLCIRTEADRSKSDLRWAVLIGFDEFCALPMKIIERAEKDAEAKTKTEEKPNVPDAE